MRRLASNRFTYSKICPFFLYLWQLTSGACRTVMWPITTKETFPVIERDSNVPFHAVVLFLFLDRSALSWFSCEKFVCIKILTVLVWQSCNRYIGGCMLRHGRHVGGQIQKNILLILLWALAAVGEQHCLIIPWRLVAIQDCEFYLRTFPRCSEPCLKLGLDQICLKMLCFIL